MKKFLQVFWLPLALAMLVIGIDQTLRHAVWQEGLLASYPYFMLASIFLLLHKFQKSKASQEASPRSEKPTSRSKRKRKKGPRK